MKPYEQSIWLHILVLNNRHIVQCVIVNKFGTILTIYTSRYLQKNGYRARVAILPFALSRCPARGTPNLYYYRKDSYGDVCYFI